MRRLPLVFGIAVALNYVWEMAQTPFYAGMDFPGAIVHCFIASLGDGLLVLLIFAAVAALTRSLDWYLRPSMQSTVAMALTGLTVGAVVEWWGLYAARRWEYSALMPIMPWLGVGAVPILQMLLLPPATFAIARRLALRNA